jgi:hypothetical protein
VFWAPAAFVVTAFAVVVVLAGAETAEAVSVDYIRQFSLYKTHWNVRAAGEQPVGMPYGTNEVLALKPGEPLVLYADISVLGKSSLTLPPNTTIEIFSTAIGVVNNEQSLGNPAVTVTIHYSPDVSDPYHGTLTITAKGVLETDDVLNVQLTTRIKYWQTTKKDVLDENGQKINEETTTEEKELALLPSNLIALRVGYDSKQGGGGCNVTGAAAVFLLPLILLALSRAKRKCK